MIYKITDLLGNLIRHGICQEDELIKQAGDRETASASTEEEIASLKAAQPGDLVTTPVSRTWQARGRRVPLDPLAVLERALRNAGVVLDFAAARTQLSQEIDAKEDEQARLREVPVVRRV